MSNNFRKFGSKNRFPGNELFRNDTIHTNVVTVNGSPHDASDNLPSVRISSSSNITNDNNIVLDQGDHPFSYGLKVVNSKIGQETTAALKIRKYNSVTKTSGGELFSLLDKGQIHLTANSIGQCGLFLYDEENGYLGILGQTAPKSSHIQLFNNDPSGGITRINFRRGIDDEGKSVENVATFARAADESEEAGAYPSLRLLAKNDLSFNGLGEDNQYNLVLEKNTVTDISGTVAMKFVVYDASGSEHDGTKKGSSAIVLEPSDGSYNMNFYMGHGPSGAISDAKPVLNIQSKDQTFHVHSLLNIHAPEQRPGDDKIQSAIVFRNADDTRVGIVGQTGADKGDMQVHAHDPNGGRIFMNIRHGADDGAANTTNVATFARAADVSGVEEFPSLRLLAKNDLSFNDLGGNRYNLVLEKNTSSGDISGTAAMKFVVYDASGSENTGTKKGSSAIVLEPSVDPSGIEAYALNFYVATGSGTLSENPTFGILNDRIRFYDPSDISGPLDFDYALMKRMHDAHP